MEHQKHGLVFEKKMIKQYNLIPSGKYTSKFDAFTKTGTPVQIKLVDGCNSRIDFGSLFRNSKVETDFYLIIGFWKEYTDNVIDIKLLKINKQIWNDMFDHDTIKKIKDTYKDYKCTTKEEQMDTNDKWKEYIKEMNKMWAPKINRIGPRFKRDSSGHIRIQCGMSMPKLEELFIYEIFTIK